MRFTGKERKMYVLALGLLVAAIALACTWTMWSRPASQTSQDTQTPTPAPSETPAPEAYLSPAREASRPVPEKRPARMLYLKLDRARFDRALSLLALTPGPIPVTLRLADENRTLRAPQNYSVRADFNRVALEELLGAENVVMK